MRKITKVPTPTAVPKDKQRGVIYVLIEENVSGNEIHLRMCAVYGTKCHH